MPSVTYYVVLPFVRDSEGELIAEEAMEAPSSFAAQRRALGLIGAKVGAIAFSREGDPQLGDFEDAVILGSYGDVPADLMSFTGCG